MVYLLPSAAFSQSKKGNSPFIRSLVVQYSCAILHILMLMCIMQSSHFFSSSKGSHFYLFIVSLELIQSSP